MGITEVVVQLLAVLNFLRLPDPPGRVLGLGFNATAWGLRVGDFLW